MPILEAGSEAPQVLMEGLVCEIMSVCTDMSLTWPMKSVKKSMLDRKAVHPMRWLMQRQR